MIFEDNDTIEGSLSNLILKDLINLTLYGNDPGCKILDGTTGSLSKQTFDKNHDIFTGVLHIHEGITIARPKGSVPKNVQVLAKSSSN